MRCIVGRRLMLGHQKACYYTIRYRGAYWDGLNAIGENVTSVCISVYSKWMIFCYAENVDTDVM